ncbi:hypothetical protein GM3708_1397 [Geminocystis sp. NIES-3708]|uniref:hypothetical protein n=1 Tax=Geminocystis sp. NIES-3708 TaxID=1615909 RepID=UPI0005FC639C|nr:hypothetical protein [Geminocystis sp. NIES-3708]BAQ60991.1 hypothetical protein GM3708_1397 [Geminocystis sp. NIES-3708]
MFVYHVEELRNQGILNLANSELFHQGQKLVKSISISKRLKQMAINICQQEYQAGRVCIVVENESHFTIWKQKIDNQLKKKITSDSPSESKIEVKPLDAQLISVCEKQLGQYVGPISKFIVDDLVAENPHITSKKLVNLVSEEIPDESHREEFKKYFINILKD